MEICDLSAASIRRALGERRISSVDVLQSCLDRIAQTNPTVNALVALDCERAQDRARELDKMAANGEVLGALHGLPVGIKDLNDTQHLRTTYGSLLFKDHVPERDEMLVARLRAAGAIILAKTNTPEFGTGSSTINKVFGATLNPFNTKMSPGGSSGGSAAALACSMLPLAHGTDTGGSLRAPAAWCGVAALRPTAGLVPSEKRRVPLSYFSVQGPMARSVEDIALFLAPMTGSSTLDLMSTSQIYDGRLDHVDLSTVRVGVSCDLGVAPIEDGIRRTFEARIKQIEPFVGVMDTFEPDMRDARDVFWTLRSVAFLTNHLERYREHGDSLSPNLIANVEAGLTMTAEQVAWAYGRWGELAKEFSQASEAFDIVLCPGNATTPFSVAQGIPSAINGKPLENYMDASLIRS
ncbi:MAG: amidase, partial [Gammaproteobacteria bacterium]